MKYKVVYVCYLTRRGRQKQFAFISKARQAVRISEMLDTELHKPLIEVEYFKTEEEARADAMKYCGPGYIF